MREITTEKKNLEISIFAQNSIGNKKDEDNSTNEQTQSEISSNTWWAFRKATESPLSLQTNTP